MPDLSFRQRVECYNAELPVERNQNVHHLPGFIPQDPPATPLNPGDNSDDDEDKHDRHDGDSGHPHLQGDSESDNDDSDSDSDSDGDASAASQGVAQAEPTPSLPDPPPTPFHSSTRVFQPGHDRNDYSATAGVGMAQHPREQGEKLDRTPAHQALLKRPEDNDTSSGCLATGTSNSSPSSPHSSSPRRPPTTAELKRKGSSGREESKQEVRIESI